MTDEEVWRLFPFPTHTSESLTDGSLLSAHPACRSCPTHDCLSDARLPRDTIGQCRYGVNYARVDEQRVVNGFVATDVETPTKRLKKRLRAEPDRRIKGAAVLRAVDRARSLGSAIIKDFEVGRREALGELKNDPELYSALAEELRKDFQDNLTQSHDFLQLVKLVRGYAESLLYDKYPGMAADEAAEKLPQEGAIYFSTELMLVKMDSMLFLNEINRAHGNETRFQPHPFVLKYVRIYRWQADQKELKLRLEGRCFTPVYYNSQAIGAVVQGLLDNLVKYSPAGSHAVVKFEESETGIRVSFHSLGPRIEPDEFSKIFLPKYRARAAQRVELGGMGVGLATAKGISDALNLNLTVDQSEEEDSRFVGRYQTTFSFEMEPQE